LPDVLTVGARPVLLKTGQGGAVPPFHVMDVIASANAMQAALPPGAPPVIHMEAGQPGTGAPSGAIAAVQAALSAGRPMGYTETFGLPSLRERLCAHLLDWYGVRVERSRVAVTTGASGAFPLAFIAAFDPGDRVALAAPYYPPYVNILTALGMVPVILPAGPESRFQPTPAMLDRLDPPPQGLIVASPCNPVGSMLHPDEFAALAAWCARHGTRFISDEIYHGLTYGQPMSTASDIPGAIVINSFSKYFSMTGWRVGWMVLPEDLVRPVERLAQNLFISPPHISQVAAEAALDCHAELAGNVAAYRRNRDHLLRTLPQAGFSRLSPAEGAFYLYADVSDRTDDSAAFCARMLAETGVAASPGIDFDGARGSHFVRFSYCGAESMICDAADRLSRFT
jgi:aspartate/methionine/tyrosine aminotransferase